MRRRRISNGATPPRLGEGIQQTNGSEHRATWRLERTTEGAKPLKWNASKPRESASRSSSRELFIEFYTSISRGLLGSLISSEEPLKTGGKPIATSHACPIVIVLERFQPTIASEISQSSCPCFDLSIYLHVYNNLNV